MGGTIRIFTTSVLKILKEKIVQICENTAKSFGCTAEVEFIGEDSTALPTINTKKEAENVQRVAEKVFGVANVSGEGLPLPGSEDFAFFLEDKPGAFFALGIK